MAVSAARRTGCQELPEDSWIPGGQARQQRVKDLSLESQTDLAANPDPAAFLPSDIGCLIQYLSLFPHKWEHLLPGEVRSLR